MTRTWCQHLIRSFGSCDRAATGLISTGAPLALDFENVIGYSVLTTETRTLKASLLFCTGGRLSRSKGGAVITALQDVSLTINQGERIALIGYNGAGKSTFLRLVSGIIIYFRAF